MMAGVGRALLAVALLVAAGCASFPPGRGPVTDVFRMDPANRGSERYSAWFADSDGRVIYFGLSAFWEASWTGEGGGTADLAVPGDYLIGRFDMESERFLAPLRVRGVESGARSSVWDVLVHSSGRICYTTYFEDIGCVEPDGDDAVVFEAVGTGFNELTEGPEGALYVTRYMSVPVGEPSEAYGAVVVLSADGELLREFRFEREDGDHTAPKSIAVDPRSGEIWINTDSFRADGSVFYETVRLAPDGEVRARDSGPPELHFVRFDARGRGWFAEAWGETLRLRVVADDSELASVDLGPRYGYDFIQDIHFDADGAAVLALWSGRVFVARLRNAALEVRALRLRRPNCPGLAGPPLVYSAFVYAGHVYATAHCGGTVLRAPLPPVRVK